MHASTTYFDDPALAPQVAHWSAVCAPFTADFFVRHPWLSLPAAPPAVHTASVPIALATAVALRARTGGDGLATTALVASALSIVLGQHAKADTVVVDTPPLAIDVVAADTALPTVIPLASEGTLDAHLAMVAGLFSATYTHQDFPLTAFATTCLGRPRPSSNVLLQVDGVHASCDATAYDVHIVVAHDSDLTVTVHGRAPSCPPEFVTLLATHLGEALAAHAIRSLPMASVDIATSAERARIAQASQPEAMAFDAAMTIPARFAETAARHPDAEAVRIGEQVMSYGQLEAQANALAQALRASYDIAPGEAIGVAVSRSPLTLVALLAVLKVGAIYVPLDHEYPEERLTFMASDAALRVLLVQSEHLEALMSLYEIPMFALDLQLDSLEPADAPPDVALSPDAPAYIIYTSGSTGKPKAVALAHRGVMNMVVYHAAALGVDASDRLLQFYAMSFDSSLFECFMALLNGATLVLADRDTIADPMAMSAYIEAHGITMLTMPPVYLGALDRARLGSVRRIISAGDACRVQDAVAFARQCAYYNSYGPTETTVCSTLYRVDPAVAYGSRIPIGTAIANTGVLLLDEQLRSVADGVPGELCVSGVSLAVGYLHQDELTARQFPSYDVDGGRIYRTGDLAVRRPDGQLELLGRRDNQVKIRGYRIELGEIEAVLSQVDGVRDVAVLAQDEPSGRRLVAYTTGAVDESALRDAIARRLPTFMMPSAFHVLAEMPTTANGKIDRKQLPSLVETTIADDSADQELTPVQAVLVRIWREVLQRPVGLHDDFFALGGDSILVIQVASRARAEGVRITPAQLFEHPTVAALSTVAVLSARALDDGGPAQGMAPLGPMQHWFFEQESAAPHHFNQTLLLEAPQGLDVSAVRSAVAAVVEKHDALRLAFTRAKDGWQAAYMPAPADAPLSVVDLSSLAPAERMARLLADGAARQDGFVLEAPPLLQAVAYVAGAGEPAWLLLLAHHLVVDGVSWRILLDDLQESYVAALRGQSHALRSRTTSYGAWIARLQEEVPQFEAELPYWVDVVSYPTPALPRDLDPPGTPRVASVVPVRLRWTADDTRALLNAAPQVGAEVPDVLLSALGQAITAWTGEDTLSITLERHGRLDQYDDVDLSQTVGWCTSQFPVRLPIPTTAGPLDTLRAVQDTLRAVPNMGVGYGVLRSLADDATGALLRMAPMPPVAFNYLGQAAPRDVDGISWHPVRESVSGDVSPAQHRSHVFEINALVLDGQLTVEWAYSTEEYQLQTVERLAASFDAQLRALLTACASTDRSPIAAGTIPSTEIDPQALAVLLGQLRS